eukprot:Colp12_sorted_trinity150504_noHs@7868
MDFEDTACLMAERVRSVERAPCIDQVEGVIRSHPLFPLLLELENTFQQNHVQNCVSIEEINRKIESHLCEKALRQPSASRPSHEPIFTTDQQLDLYMLTAIRRLRDKLACQIQMCNVFVKNLDIARTELSEWTKDLETYLSSREAIEQAEISEKQITNTPTGPRRGVLPRRAVDLLRKWLMEHQDNPYPSDEDKRLLVEQSGLTKDQINNWFINARRRVLQPLLERDRSTQRDPEN